MDALLPSEIARLVLGYLQEQKCEEVAKMFLETSPHLQECRLVAQRGSRYSTKVGGLNLTDMLDKYCAANSIIQEKLNKVSDSEQIKNCNDIAEQLRYLLEGSRGHRFVVNINVPTQNSPSGSFGTPVLTTSSSRKRQHSSSDRGKRVVKSLNSVLELEKDSQTPTGLNCDTVEATPLQSLPGHSPLAKQLRVENHTNIVIKKPLNTLNSPQSVTEESKSNAFTSVGTQSDINVMRNTHENRSTETALTSNLVQTPSKCTEGTNTEQPMSYCSTEVQTTPLDLFDTEHDIDYEPIENLNILTEALLHRPELAEEIAQNINKSIIPIQENVQENPNANLSLLQGFDSAVKSAVEISDKTLDALFNEMFTVDTNQNEDSNEMYNQDINDGVSNENLELMDVDNNTESMSSQLDQQIKRPEVPLKQRLRSSSKSQTNPDEDERDCNALLDNQNEEAIRSIVANALANKQSPSAESSPQETAENSTATNVQQPEHAIPNEIPSTDNENIEPNKNANNKKPAKPRKNPRKPRNPKQKASKSNNSIEALAEKIKIQEQNMMTMPTLILCSETDVQPSLPMKHDGYVPIAPKPTPTDATLTVLQENPTAEANAPKIYLRTVNVPRHLVKPTQLEGLASANQIIMQLQASPQKNNATTTSCSGSPIVVITDAKQQQRGTRQQRTESITLYGDDSNSEVRVSAPVANMPVISLDESTCNLATGTGLSPFFKDNPDAEVKIQMNQDQPKTVDTKKLVKERKTTTKASDKKGEPEQQKQSNDKKEDQGKRSEIKEDKKGKANEMTNPMIVVTVPDEDETVSPEKESKLPKKVVENVESKTDEKSANVNKEKSIPESKENKLDDKIIPAKSEVNKQPIVVEKENKIEEKEDSKVVKKSVAAKKDTKPEEKSAPTKEDCKAEEKSLPTKEDSKTSEEYTTSEEKPVPVKKDIKLEEKANKESNIKEKTGRADALITKRTPKSLLKDRSKNNRLSLSTPRRRNSHIRALDFDERTPEHDTNTRKVPQSCTRPKSSAVQGLFQSPPFSGETPPVTLTEPIEEPRPVRTHVSVPPIATRSPAPKLQGNWNKVAGIGMILGDFESSPEKSQSSMNLSNVVEETERPKSWDSDLRKIVGDVNEEDDKRPKSAKKCRRRNSIKGKTIEEPKSAKKNASKTPTREQLKITPPPATLKPKINVPMKTSPELLASFRDLQTPCKVEIVNVPPTPRVMFATPGACLVKIGSGKEISIKDCVNTPDFPPTPCIVLTPKIVEEEEHEKKPSPYYEPSEDTTPKEIVNSEKIMFQEVTTVTKSVTIQKKNVVELQESKTVAITKFGVIEENMAQKEMKKVESASEDNSKEIIEEESMEETNASADTTNTDSDSDSDSNSNSSTSSSSSNSSSSDSSSSSSNASSPTKSVNISHHDNSATESEVDSPQRVPNSSSQIDREEPVCPAESSPKKESPPPLPPPPPPPPPPKVIVEKSPQAQQLTSTISAIITNEKPISKLSDKPKIINIQTISPPAGISRRELEEKRQRVMAKFKQTANAKRPVTVKQVTAVKKVEVKQPVKKVVKQPSAKKIKPSPKTKVPKVTIEEVKPKNVLENEKGNPKTKVEQVKRDLFAPTDEAEQRTTRSQSARKNVDENPALPGVLECLQLIPANKSIDESLDETIDGLSTSQANSLEVSFLYDDSVPIKKRKRNYSSSELENEYAFTFPDEDEVRIMKVQPYEEIFSMAPKVMKKKCPKTSPMKAKRIVARCPLAVSSPITKDKLQKRKLSKRKASPIKEEKQVEKKAKVEEKKGLDPQALFKKIDVEKFLKTVHVSK